MNPPRAAGARRSTAAWTAGLFALLALAVLAWSLYRQAVARAENTLLADELKLSQLELRSLRNRLAAIELLQAHEHDGLRTGDFAEQAFQSLHLARLASAGSPDSTAAATVVWSEQEGAALLVAEHLPPLPPGEVYTVEFGELPSLPFVSAGALRLDPVTGAARLVWRDLRLRSASLHFLVHRRRPADAPDSAALVLRSSP